MSSPASSITIVCVAPDQLLRFWKFIGPWLYLGQMECSRGDHEDAAHTLVQHVLKAQQNLTQFWMVIDEKTKETIGAFTSEIYTDLEKNRKAVFVHRLAGANLIRWGQLITQRMIEFGKAEGCSVIAFIGRKGLLRTYKNPNLRIVGEAGRGTDGEMAYVFEGAI